MFNSPARLWRINSTFHSAPVKIKTLVGGVQQLISVKCKRRVLTNIKLLLFKLTPHLPSTDQRLGFNFHLSHSVKGNPSSGGSLLQSLDQLWCQMNSSSQSHVSLSVCLPVCVSVSLSVRRQCSQRDYSTVLDHTPRVVSGQVSNRLPPILQPAQSDERAGRLEMMILTKCSSEISVRQSQETRQEQHFTSQQSIASYC